MSHFTGGPCAEHVALGNALAGGIRNAVDEEFRDGGGESRPPGVEGLERLICIVAVFNRGRGVVNPCGKCRQILADYHPGIEVIVREGEGLEEIGARKIEELLPLAYSWKKTALA
jgi:cytidine deaminase